MITLRYPDLLPHIVNFPYGLRAITIQGEDRTLLIVKVPKEAILAAKVKKGFKVYFAPIELNGKSTVGAIAAFFDDNSSPLAVRIPLFNDAESLALIEALQQAEIDVYFFDDLNREMLGYVANITAPLRAMSVINKASFFEVDVEIGCNINTNLDHWFSEANENDDASALSIAFHNPIFPEETTFINLQEDSHEFHGNKGYSSTTLIREEAGKFQEQDIVYLLQRIFPKTQIYANPLRSYDKEEIADVIVITDSHIIVVQAKDSPNTERSLARTLERKQLASIKSLKKAIRQISGAINYTRFQSPFQMILQNKNVSINIENREIISLIILSEMFDNQYFEYSRLLLTLIEKTKVPCIALDYAELMMFTSHLANQNEFLAAYFKIFSFGKETGEFPRLRIVGL